MLWALFRCETQVYRASEIAVFALHDVPLQLLFESHLFRSFDKLVTHRLVAEHVASEAELPKKGGGAVPFRKYLWAKAALVAYTIAQLCLTAFVDASSNAAACAQSGRSSGSRKIERAVNGLRLVVGVDFDRQSQFERGYVAYFLLNCALVGALAAALWVVRRGAIRVGEPLWRTQEQLMCESLLVLVVLRQMDDTADGGFKADDERFLSRALRRAYDASRRRTEASVCAIEMTCHIRIGSLNN